MVFKQQSLEEHIITAEPFYLPVADEVLHASADIVAAEVPSEDDAPRDE